MGKESSTCKGTVIIELSEDTHCLTSAGPKLKDGRPAFKQPVFKQPVFKQPDFKQPVFKQPVFKHRLAKKDASTYKRTEILDLTEDAHGSSSIGAKIKDGKSAFKYRLKKKGRLLSNKKQLPGIAPTLKNRPILAKGHVIARSTLTQAAHQRRQHRTVLSSTSKSEPKSTPSADPVVEASPLYIIKASLGKGLGMFATRDIRKGTRILAEKPFFSLTERPEVDLTDPYEPNDVEEEFLRLPASQRLKYMSLHCPERNDCSPFFGIYEANCYEMGSGTCICLDASRINHSCVPNSHYAWNEDLKKITVHAVKDIGTDEEITITYCHANRTYEERKLDLEPYHFTCTCPACQTNTAFGIWSRVRRQQMLDLDQEIADYQHDPLAAQEKYGHLDEGSAITKIVSLIDEEGLVFEKSRAYHDAAECALKRGLKMEALEYANRELDMDACCMGKDSPLYKETMSFFLKILLGVEQLSKDYGSGTEDEKHRLIR